jgi:hypothetical protein
MSKSSLKLILKHLGALLFEILCLYDKWNPLELFSLVTVQSLLRNKLVKERAQKQEPEEEVPRRDTEKGH